MGQKVNPIGLRLGIIRSADSTWFSSGKSYGDWLVEDQRLRTYILEKFKSAGISRAAIERAAKKCKVTIFTARPGILIGKQGAGVEQLQADLQKLSKSELSVNIQEVRKPELDSKLVAEAVAQQLERRVAFRRAMKKVMASAQKLGAKGIRVCCSGRLGGAEMSRTEWYREGRVPLHTLRADIDYGVAEALTTYGIIGVKVWIFKGEKLSAKKQD